MGVSRLVRSKSSSTALNRYLRCLFGRKLDGLGDIGKTTPELRHEPRDLRTGFAEEAPQIARRDDANQLLQDLDDGDERRTLFLVRMPGQSEQAAAFTFFQDFAGESRLPYARLAPDEDERTFSSGDGVQQSDEFLLLRAASHERLTWMGRSRRFRGRPSRALRACALPALRKRTLWSNHRAPTFRNRERAREDPSHAFLPFRFDLAGRWPPRGPPVLCKDRAC